MVYTCPLCLLDPLSHSFTNFLEKEDTFYFYTCPAKATLYFDTISIINHYDGVLSEITENKNWIWVLDVTSFGLNHFLQIEVAKELSKLISSKFSKKLKKIIIINPNNYVFFVYSIVKSFLTDKIKSIIEINNEIKSMDDF